MRRFRHAGDMDDELRVVSPVPAELYPEVLRLLRQTWWGRERDLELVAQTHGGCVESVALVRSDGTVAACARAMADGGARAMIHDVIVDECDRRRGLGRAVMAALLALPRLDVAKIELHCAAEHESFYESLGFAANPDELRIMNRVKQDTLGEKR